MCQQEFALVVEIANTTGKQPMLNYLATTQANVIIFVEHRLLKDEIPDLAAKLLAEAGDPFGQRLYAQRRVAFLLEW